MRLTTMKYTLMLHLTLKGLQTELNKGRIFNRPCLSDR